MTKPRTKQEVARMWERCAQSLWRTVHTTPELMKQLQYVNYRKRQHYVSDKQIKIIAEYFGYEINI